MSIQEILSELQNCEKLQLFPKKISNFKLFLELKETPIGIDIFNYENNNKFAKISLFYNIATKDYILKEALGLTEFCNIKFINPNRDLLLDMLLTNLTVIIQRYSSANTNPILLEKGIMQFNFNFPSEINGFKLIVSPSNPFSYLSGSSIILDYTNFATNKQLLIYYNEFRNDFFAEYRVNNVLFPCSKFDCNTLVDLEDLLNKNLYQTLKEI